MSGTSETTIPWDGSGQPWTKPTTARHRFVLPIKQAYVLEVEDAHFNHDSAVFLPEFGPCEVVTSEAAEEHKEGLALLAAVYHHAAENPQRRILLTGHADTSGSDSYNLELSRLRARGVAHALTGERDAWVAIVNEQRIVQDYQQILRWIADVWFWDCDPGEPDNDPGPLTEGALEAFQHLFNEQFDAGIGVDGDIGPQTWGAFFDVYMQMLMDMLDTDEQGLADARASLSFLDDGQRAVGCGEHFPVEADRQDNYRSRTNRRVEILFFDPGEEPTLACHAGGGCNPDACQLYRPPRYRFEHLPCIPFHPNELLPEVFLLDGIGDRIPHALWRARDGGAIVGEGQANELGLAVLPSARLPDLIELEWAPPPGQGPAPKDFPYSREYYVRVPQRDKREGGRRKLSNLGFHLREDDPDNVIEFQLLLGLDETGRHRDIEELLDQWHRTGDRPGSGADADDDLTDPGPAVEVVLPGPEDMDPSGEPLHPDDVIEP